MQRNKIGETSIMKMGGVDWKETEIQEKAAKNKADKEKWRQWRQLWRSRKSWLRSLKERSRLDNLWQGKTRMNKRKTGKMIYSFLLLPVNCLRSRKEADDLVDEFLEEKLGQAAHMVVRYLSRSKHKRNTMPQV
jgi:hypothetical protein